MSGNIGGLKYADFQRLSCANIMSTDMTMIWPTSSELSQGNQGTSSTDSSEQSILYYNMSVINIA